MVDTSPKPPPQILPPLGGPTQSPLRPPPPPPLLIPWYRRNAWVTGMVGGILLLGPFLAPFVLFILITGPVYTRGKNGAWGKWETSTTVLVGFFAVMVTVMWVLKVFEGRIGPSF